MTEKINSAYTKEINKYRLLSNEEEKQLAGRIANGDDNAFDELVNCNLRLVMKIAHQYKGLGVDLEDIVGAGNVGLLEAARRYKADRKVRFDSYAHYWIRYEIRNLISRMAGATTLSTSKYNNDRIIRETKEEMGEQATDEEVSKKCGFSPKHVREVLNRSNKKVYLAQKVRGDNDKKTYLDLFEDATQRNAYDSIDRQDQLDLLYRSLNVLDNREKYIIESFFGLHDMKQKSMTEIGNEFGFTREYIRQIRHEALKKLRHEMMKEM